jgi:hypothetical protein
MRRSSWSAPLVAAASDDETATRSASRHEPPAHLLRSPAPRDWLQSAKLTVRLVSAVTLASAATAITACGTSVRVETETVIRATTTRPVRKSAPGAAESSTTTTLGAISPATATCRELRNSVELQYRFFAYVAGQEGQDSFYTQFQSEHIARDVLEDLCSQPGSEGVVPWSPSSY